MKLNYICFLNMRGETQNVSKLFLYQTHVAVLTMVLQSNKTNGKNGYIICVLVLHKRIIKFNYTIHGRQSNYLRLERFRSCNFSGHQAGYLSSADVAVGFMRRGHNVFLGIHYSSVCLGRPESFVTPKRQQQQQLSKYFHYYGVKKERQRARVLTVTSLYLKHYQKIQPNQWKCPAFLVNSSNRCP